MSFKESHRASRSGRAVSLVVVISVLAVLVVAGVIVALTSAAAGEQPSASSAPKPTVEAVDPQRAEARAAAAATVEQLLPIANNATGIASAVAVAGLQIDVAGLDTASRVGSETELNAASAEVQTSLAAFATSAAESCEAHLAEGTGGAAWAAAAADDCVAVRTAITGGADVVPSLVQLEAAGAPAAS